MIQIIKKLRVLLDKKQKRTMVGLIILMVISAFLQTAGVGMLVELSYVLHYCHGAADSGICGEEPVYLCTAEADFILCLYEPVPHFRAHDA